MNIAKYPWLMRPWNFEENVLLHLPKPVLSLTACSGCSWYFILITTSLPSPSSLQTAPYTTPHTPSNLWSLFSSIIVCIYVFVYSYIFPNVSCWVHIMLLACIFTVFLISILIFTNKWSSHPSEKLLVAADEDYYRKLELTRMQRTTDHEVSSSNGYNYKMTPQLRFRKHRRQTGRNSVRARRPGCLL